MRKKVCAKRAKKREFRRVYRRFVRIFNSNTSSNYKLFLFTNIQKHTHTHTESIFFHLISHIKKKKNKCYNVTGNTIKKNKMLKGHTLSHAMRKKTFFLGKICTFSLKPIIIGIHWSSSNKLIYICRKLSMRHARCGFLWWIYGCCGRDTSTYKLRESNDHVQLSHAFNQLLPISKWHEMEEKTTTLIQGNERDGDGEKEREFANFKLSLTPLFYCVPQSHNAQLLRKFMLKQLDWMYSEIDACVCVFFCLSFYTLYLYLHLASSHSNG